MNKIIFNRGSGIGLILIIIIAGIVLKARPVGEESINQSETIFQSTPTLGVYEVCSDVSDCDLKAGIEKIKATGADSVIVTVVDEDNFKSLAYYPSKYLPLAEDVSRNYLEDIVKIAHQNNVKVFASINIPHNFWLANHPDWIAVLSNGEPADTYEKDYFHRTIPPSRLISEKECQDLLKNIIDEVAAYGVDGIDINDNFQFSDEYLEEIDETLYSSFDDFTIKKFEKDKNITVQGDYPKDRADYIKNHYDIYSDWLKWRADEIIQLFKILNKDIKDTGLNIYFRPHLLTYGDPYQYYGLDYQEIAKEVDVLYLMITPEQEKEKYFDVIKQAKDAQAKRIIVSTYLFESEDWEAVEKDKDKILERIEWIKEAGADEVYVYDFKFIEEGNLWPTIKSAAENLNK